MVKIISFILCFFIALFKEINLYHVFSIDTLFYTKVAQCCFFRLLGKSSIFKNMFSDIAYRHDQI